MPIATGRYSIQNARSGNRLELPDPNDASAVIAAAENPITAQKWNIVDLANGKYTIQNQGQSSFANCGVRAPLNAEVVGRNASQPFVIQETRVKDQYIIMPSDVQLCWGLPDEEIGTPVVLCTSHTDARNQWKFIK